MIRSDNGRGWVSIAIDAFTELRSIIAAMTAHVSIEQKVLDYAMIFISMVGTGGCPFPIGPSIAG